MTYKDGIPISLQLFEDGDLIKDTHHVVTSVAHNSKLPNDKDPDGDARTDRRLVSGLIKDNEIMDGSYGQHTYTCAGDKWLE